MKKPVIEVGIFSADCISFKLNGRFSSGTNHLCNMKGEACTADGDAVLLRTEGEQRICEKVILLEPEDGGEDAFFELFDVVIGLEFHWERKRNMSFKGKLKLMVCDGRIMAVNVLPLEEYLLSVIASEMSASSSVEFLKAHAVISRSWLLAQMEKSRALRSAVVYETVIRSDEGYMRWYDREEHKMFDVCADDHCQRYHGFAQATSIQVAEAMRVTAGEVLMHDGKICDARFSKCCGGITEAFENVWEPVVHPYLSMVVDSLEQNAPSPDLTSEEEAKRWIMSEPAACCNTDNLVELSQVLTGYDFETRDFFRWTATLQQDEVQRLLSAKTGMDFGEILDLVPVERGVSGRIVRLKIVGSRQCLTVGKELEIRKLLSSSHLYSSAFVVEKVFDGANIRTPTSFILHGAGWGHGVGLCQIGAAMMGARGYSYREILNHYFPGAILYKVY
ncbi:MAG: SpoIID/LytB domain-containing protein [Tannerellaceae bacterium]|jgi:SpoIID/LytB domain protein|nr:SpoIID/LytB domain-containing protein [Tannerellaceae bacterium]